MFFTDPQRRAMLDACHIAGLNTMRLMHETTATALAYGIFKTAEFGDDPHNVVFVDVGHSAMQVCVVRFTKVRLKILATAIRPQPRRQRVRPGDVRPLLRGVQGDEEDRHQVQRARVPALRVAVEKMKKILSSNPEAPLSIECLMDDQDVRPA